MAHEMSINKAGQTEAMFAVEKPWHGLGTMVEKLQTPTAALKLAHLEWNVDKEPIYRANGEQIPGRAITVRSDTKAYLGDVGEDWVPVQNEEQARFIEALLGTGEATVECVGALQGGRRTFQSAIRNPQSAIG